MRLKHRFFICQVDFMADKLLTAAADIGTSDIFMAIKNSVGENFGEIGVAASASLLAVKYYNPVTRLAIVRSPTAQADEMHASIVFVKSVKKYDAAIRVLHASSTLRTLREALVHWTTSLTSTMAASAKADDVAFDTAFWAAIDQDVADAMGGR